MANNNRGLNGINPLSYLGVNPYSPPDLIVNKGAPTESNFKNIQLGALWLDNSNDLPTVSDIYMLVKIQNGVARWVSLGS